MTSKGSRKTLAGAKARDGGRNVPAGTGPSRRDFLRGVGLAGLALSGWGTARGAAAAPDADDPAWAGFREPPTACRPFVRWWWNGNKLAKDEILRELDVLKAAGIGGVEINSIKFPAEKDPLNLPSLEWLGDEWCGMVRTAVDGARERGLTADIIVGSGWPFGGRFLPREHQTKILSVGRRRVAGPATVTLTEQEMVDSVDLTLHSKNDAIFKTVKFARLTPAALDRFEPGTDVTDRLRDGRLTVDVPAGDHILHFFVVQEGFQAVINGAPGSDGPVLNHFSRAATEFYLNHMSDGMKARLGGLGTCFRAVFCDSLELEGANWNEDLLPEFQRRRGYDLLPWLSYMLQKTGHMGDAVEEAVTVKAGPELEDGVQRVRYDYWITLIELFRERFLEPFVAWCRAQGVQSRVQAYGHGYDPLESSMLVDIPECETWLNMHTGTLKSHGAHSINNKFTASGARLAGKRLVSCEEITNTQYVFFTPLEMIKIAGDESNLSGVTHSILHGFNYSPPAAEFPGWVRYGTWFNERNPWWPHARTWFDYKARLSWLLQQAEPQANIAILHPLADLWKRWGMQRDPFPMKWYPQYSHLLWRALHRNGHNCDYTSEAILCRSEMKDGAAVFGPRRYDTLILMLVDTLRADTAAAIERFARCGGRILFIGRAPSVAPGLKARGGQDRAVAETMRRILAEFPDRCRVVPEPPAGGNLVEWFRGVRDGCGLVPDVRLEPAGQFLSQTRHRLGGREVFFFANTGREQAVSVKATFRTGDATPWIWDPETGERRVHPWLGARNELHLRLAPAESRVIVFEPAPSDPPPPEPWPAEEGAVAVGGPCKVDLHHVDGTRRTLELSAPVDLGTVDGLAGFAGRAVYRIALHLPHGGPTSASAAPTARTEPGPPDRRVAARFLDLGTVREISEVALDGRPLGCRWYGRHVYALPDGLAPGAHDLEVTVTTVAGNYCKTLAGNETAQKWTAKLPQRPMGLLGPVRLLRAG